MKTIEIPPRALNLAGLILAGHKLSQIEITIIGDASGQHILLSGPAAAVDKFSTIFDSALQEIENLEL